MTPTLRCLLVLSLVHMSTARIIQPLRADNDADSIYAPRMSPISMGRIMQMAYNQSIPIESIRACEKESSIACPSTSPDGTHKCVSPTEICDHRPQCPQGEDETPVICFFHEVHTQELTRLRQFAIAVYRSSYHSHRMHRY